MQHHELAETIYGVRTSNPPSRLLMVDENREPGHSEPMGVLLFKPSSGHLPLSTVVEILERLVVRHRYLIRSAAWWNGRDIRDGKLMSLHYPGFHRIAHGGWNVLSGAARMQLQTCYAADGAGEQFRTAFGIPFHPNLVRTPYELAETGITPKRLNQLWEMDRAAEPLVRRVQRLDEDSLCLALDLSGEPVFSSATALKSVVVLNAFYAQLEGDFQANGCVALWIQKAPDSPTSWEALRSEYAGKTNPFQAAPGTIRGDAARGLLPVETVSILANVIHLSATEAEGWREVREVWWAPGRFNCFHSPVG